MFKYLFLIFIMLPWLQGCYDLTSMFNTGPSEEELFKKNTGPKKVFPPAFTNVTDNATLKASHVWEGSCSNGAVVEISSPKIKGGVEKIPCLNRKFSKTLNWENFENDSKHQVTFLQVKDGVKSEETLLHVKLQVSTIPKTEVVKVDPLPETKAPVAVKEEVKLAKEQPTAVPTAIVTPIIATATPTAVPVSIVLPTPAAAVEQTTKISSISTPIENEKFKVNESNEVLIDLTGAIVINEIGAGGGKSFLGAKNLIDEQRIAGDPKLNKGNSGFKTTWSEAARLNKELEYQKPFLSGIFDLGKFYELTEVYIYGGNNVVSFYAGGPVSDWLQLGQVRLSPGVWNKISFNKKINSKYLRVSIDFLSNDLDNGVAASSGSEMIVYGKPFDERAPAGIPVAKSVLTPVSFDEFLGVNLFVSDPINQEWIYAQEAMGKLKQKYNSDIFGAEAFSHTRVKLYTPWFLTHFDQDAPNWLLRFQTINLQHHNLDLDYYLSNLSKQRSIINNKVISVFPSFDYTIPSLFPKKIKEQLVSQKLLQKDAEGNLLYPWEFGRVKPLSNGEKNTGKLPKDFQGEAELYYQYSARFGKTPSQLLDQNRKLASDQKLLSGQGFISAIETHTLPDRSKNSTCAECSFFHPFEYAAYLSAIYDGDQNTLGKTLGSKNGDASTQVVFGSLSIPSIDYPLMVSMWAKDHRPSQTLPFDILAFTATSKSQGKAQIPELSGLYETFHKLVLDRNSYFPDKPIWITEFGFESNPTSNMGITVAAGYTPDEEQGIWLTRSLLLLNAAGVDRVYLQPLFDNSQYSTSSYGLVQSAKDNYKPKMSYFMVTSLMKALQGYVFDKFVDVMEDSKNNMDAVTLKFKNKDQPKKFIYVTWTPTNNGANHILSKYSLPTEEKPTKAQILNLSSTTLDVQRTPASLNEKGSLTFDVKETPTLVEIEIP